MKAHKTCYPIDNSAILYLAQMGPDHTNVYRFTVTLTEPVSPEYLQQAADRICPRFPTILAGFRPGPFTYDVVPVQTAPIVRKDPGLLHTMQKEEIHSCAYRIYHNHCQIIIEAFHSLTDGFGAVASLQALLGEYFHLRYGLTTPEQESLLLQAPDWREELRDSYLDYSGSKTASLPMYAAYQLPGVNRTNQVHSAAAHVSTLSLRTAARNNGISVTSLLAGLMAETIMELQHRQHSGSSKKPVRIMVPVDLRRQFPSKTFRNFILYALPTLRHQDAALPRRQRFLHFQEQIRQQTNREVMAGQITRNVKLQNSILFRILPRLWKCALMRLSYRFFGEINSSITLTNLGPIKLSAELQPHVKRVDVYLTPRRNSPYNCAVLSSGDTTSITITRFGTYTELETLFFSKLHSMLSVDAPIL